MPNYRRFRVEGGCYFFTVVLADRKSHLLVDYIQYLRQAFREVMRAHPFKIDAAVVLPEHLHCIWTLPMGDDNYSMRWRQIKSAFSRRLPSTEQYSLSQIRKKERGIWQRRFWEHTICDEYDYYQHIDYIHFDYIHYNPVKHGYVKQVIDWKYSSFHRAVSSGIYPPNWGEEMNDETNNNTNNTKQRRVGRAKQNPPYKDCSNKKQQFFRFIMGELWEFVGQVFDF